jgi:hypothetical protein
LDKLATPYDKNPEDVEFHASTIFSRREHPWKSLTVDDARGVLKSVLRVAAASYETTPTRLSLPSRTFVNVSSSS